MNLKEKLKNGEVTVGSWMTIGDCAIAEIMAKSGFDWIAIDLEHSAIDLAQAEQLIRVINLAGCEPLVRVGENSAYYIKHAMDAGARGVIVPMVNTKVDAQKAVDSAKYPPVGKRGVGLARAQGYGADFDGYKKWVEKESVVIVQIEHVEAINNLEKILSVSGVDASMIGQYDLSASMGCPGEFQRKEMKEAIKKYLNVCKKTGKSAGIHVIPPESDSVRERINAGFNFIVFSFDAMFFLEKINKEMKGLGR